MKHVFLQSVIFSLFFVVSLLPIVAQQPIPYEVEYQVQKQIKDFRFSIGGGYANRLGKLEQTGDSQLDNLSEQLLNGVTVDADAQYFFKEGWGFGLNANYCSSNASGNNINLPNVGNVNSYNESQNTLFIGPSFVARNESSKFILLTSVAMGPLFYTNKMTLDEAVVDAARTTFGFNAGIAGEYKLNNKTGIGIKLSYILGTINSVDIEGQTVEYDEPSSVSNLMISAFISFRTW